MPESNPEISVCLCTYKRPDKLSDCLNSLLNQTVSHKFEVIVTDNDSHRSGKKIVHEFEEAFQVRGIPIAYLVEPVQNISLARNRCVQAARGNLIAFIDDDERASTHWLTTLYQVLRETDADGVWGPVFSDVPQSFPKWMRHSNLFNRPMHTDKSVMLRGELRTGNAMVKRTFLDLRAGPFNKSFGKTGGEDSEFFSWLQNGMREGPFNKAFGKTGGGDTALFTWLQYGGCKFVWAAHAEVLEAVDEKRRYIRWHLRRAYRSGWGDSKVFVIHYGTGIALLISLSRIIPSLFKTVLNAILKLNNPKYAGLLILANIFANLGKLGYFVGIKIEEYKG